MKFANKFNIAGEQLRMKFTLVKLFRRRCGAEVESFL